jgi:hypothetical protein
MRGRIARGKRFPRRFVDALVVRREPERSSGESRCLPERATARAAHDDRDAAHRERSSEDAADRSGQGDERDAPGDAEGTPRPLLGHSSTTDGHDVERLPRRSSLRAAGLKSTRPIRSERYAGRTSTGTGHASYPSNVRAGSAPSAEFALGRIQRL